MSGDHEGIRIAVISFCVIGACTDQFQRVVVLQGFVLPEAFDSGMHQEKGFTAVFDDMVKAGIFQKCADRSSFFRRQLHILFCRSDPSVLQPGLKIPDVFRIAFRQILFGQVLPVFSQKIALHKIGISQ